MAHTTAPKTAVSDSTESGDSAEVSKKDPVSPETEPGTTEEAKAQVVASDEGDHVTMVHPADGNDTELLVGSVSKVSGTAGEPTDPPDYYNAQCSLCAQVYEGEDQQEITDQLNAHYKAAHVLYDGAGL